MISRPLAATVAVLVTSAAVAGCAQAYTGASRRIGPEHVRVSDGWLVVDAPAIRQRRDSDCGAAALAMVAARWRPTLDLPAISRAATPHRNGYRLGDLRDVARRAGLRAFAIVGDRNVLAQELGRGRPVIVGLHRPHGKRVRSHYEVVVGLHPDGRVATIDPADASWHVRPWNSLLAEWQPAGRPMLVVLGTDVALSRGMTKPPTSPKPQRHPLRDPNIDITTPSTAPDLVPPGTVVEREPGADSARISERRDGRDGVDPSDTMAADPDGVSGTPAPSQP